jgi:hypothetical protein
MPTESLLRILAERPNGRDLLPLRYDRDRQVSQICVGGEWTDTWLSPVLSGTKKFDVETGEDAKGE